MKILPWLWPGMDWKTIEFLDVLSLADAEKKEKGQPRTFVEENMQWGKEEMSWQRISLILVGNTFRVNTSVI